MERFASQTTLRPEAEQADLLRRVEQFLFLEARLQDTHAYDEWEALWADDATYWVPANGSDTDPERQMSIIYDNRSRIGVRIDQLKTGRRHTQTPRSELARIISNVELVDQVDDEINVRANAFIFEDNLRGETLWAARNEYRLRIVDGGFKLVRKKVGLVNNHKPIFTLSFLI
ncbi:MULTISPECIES: aromatic-ring-hydroxylating dioxygenase subunit beta [Bradyrhizobium]|uniref:3-phenylpropionate/cinnamic acid dioxygenase, small subunit n=1 Tax=Bradyrhizobium brasilense TaxID=1419277 RepID=A0A1G7JLS3_9BRAD|nr:MULTISPECIES: aromatic-ring-hydroxylating dioxygenase subunit beta [Bradyrhizobium]MCA6104295.1 aromatic-ring-hydroxylating dioxygenase subunit beta [Bradyrhizobium australafricanum]MCC8975246.1 aromatic-ring-hydroxylating dioxygenase subunit beta [Bradyrhizobium brasilense]SDF25910.1 3-phenylpropionate/cinnamic acid dioxygenase, small subunit [Bradyrhizobium brasilense]